jgi:hypothetical protein
MRVSIGSPSWSSKTSDAVSVLAVPELSLENSANIGRIFVYNHHKSIFYFLISPGSNSILFNYLPVELLNFQVILQAHSVNITWQTAEEVNNNYFLVERSEIGVEWVAVSPEIKGAGNSSQINNYSFVDINPIEGKSLYRIKQVDFDGSNSYSDKKAISLSSETSRVVKIYPNPCKSNLTIQVSELPEGSIRIMNSFGQEVTSTIHLRYDSDHYAVDISYLRKGLYFVHMEGQVVKVLKNN